MSIGENVRKCASADRTGLALSPDAAMVFGANFAAPEP
jgi:hypothetical protein